MKSFTEKSGSPPISFVQNMCKHMARLLIRYYVVRKQQSVESIFINEIKICFKRTV